MFRRVLSPALVCALILLGLPLGTMPAAAISPDVIISQVYGGGGNTGATIKNDFIELFNRGPVAVSLSGWSVQYASSTGSSWSKTDLSGSISPGGYYLIQEAAGTATGTFLSLQSPEATGTIAMSLSAGKVALRNTNALITGTACPTSDVTVVDFVGYGNLTNCSEGSPAPTLTNTTAARRLVNGTQDTDKNSIDFVAVTPSPRDAAPSVFSTSPPRGGGGVAQDANITVTFSEPVTVNGEWFSISCVASGTHSAIATGAGAVFTLNPTADFSVGESCTVTVKATQVTDQDLSDPPDAMVADYSWSFTTDVAGRCGDPATLIHEIQGNGTTSPLLGSQRTIEGVVIGAYQGAGQFGGFYVQEEDAQADSAADTSEGIFVLSSNTVAVGQVVRVTGLVTEDFDLTEIASVSRLLVCSAGSSVTPTPITLPVPSLTYFERYEGMLVTFTQTLTATETFTLGRYGEVLLSANGRLYTPTAVTTPGAAAIALADLNQRSSFVLDDGDGMQNIDPTINPTGGLSAANTLRSGYTVGGLKGVFDQRFGTYRLQPVGPVPFAAANPRTAAPATVGGNTRIASFNVLNFFNGDGLGGGFPTARGASTSFEFGRQKAKEISALVAMNADIVGLMELENDATPNSAIEGLVAGLNAALGAGTYAFIDTGVIGTDLIKVGLIYKPATVTAIGAYKLMTSSVDPRFIDTRNRPSLAQTFERNGAGARLTVVVNHLKSKGSACSGDIDTGDGQGDCNVTRRNAAAALVNWLATDPTGSGDPRVLLIGDMNAYTFEDPITTFTNGGFTNLVRQFNGLDAYSYVFDGQSGYLDHALASSALAAQATGAVDWHINADEPTVLDYNTEFKSANQVNTLYDAGPYRSSDHDPVVIGLDLRDTTLPKITGAATSAPNALGWYTADVTVQFTCTDNLAVVSCGPDVTLTADGAGRSVTGTTRDAAGNTASATVSGINIDKTAPTITGAATTAPNALGWYTADVTVHFTCTDNLSVASCGPDVTLTTDGAGQSVTGTVTDAAGNTTSTTVIGINIDKTAPTISGAATTGPNASGWYSAAVTVHFACADNLAVVSCGPDVTLTVDGAGQSVTGTATDAAGNTASFTVTGINLDTTTPAISGASTTAANANGWYNADVTVHFTCTDNIAYVTCTADQTLTSEGAGQSATGTVTDQAGNTASTTVSGINIDKTAPGITGAATTAPNALGWYKADVTVHFTCTDNIAYLTCTADQTLTSEGAGQSVPGTVTDQAGNTASTTVNGINIDKTAPTIIGAPTTAANGNGWYNADVTVHFTCADTLSGVTCAADQTLTAEGANQSVPGTVTDQAGNTASTIVRGINIDKTAPTITGAATTAPNANGWYKADVIVQFTCVDTLSGVTCAADQTLTREGPAQSVTGTVMDRAGNAASATVSGINIDKTAPTVTFGGNAGTYSITDTIAITCTATDALSGLASQSCPSLSAPAYALGLGSHTLTATATDNAGNTTTVTTRFTVTADTTSLCTLTRTFVANEGLANSLCQKLDAAAAAAARGQAATARNILDAYEHEVEAQRGKKITDAHATILIAIATTL